jgi:hypothetical protein
MFGRILQHGTTYNNTANEIKINTAGIYLLHISDEKGNVETEKIIVQ